ncbi:hypothetical protein Ancab_010415, partial [Ancistrocladus abbreviatus]
NLDNIWVVTYKLRVDAARKRQVPSPYPQLQVKESGTRKTLATLGRKSFKEALTGGRPMSRGKHNVGKEAEIHQGDYKMVWESSFEQTQMVAAVLHGSIPGGKPKRADK